MPVETIHECGCGPCTRHEAHPGREYHRHMNLLLSRLDEQQRRWYLAVESERFGYGADRILFEITGVDEKTIRRGRQELAASLVDRPVNRVRLPGGGRPRTKKRLDHRRYLAGAGRTRNGGRPDDRPDLGTPQPTQPARSTGS